MLETLDEEENADVLLFPPDNDAQSDEDSDDEEEIQPKDVNHLGKGILSQPAELIVYQQGDVQLDGGTELGDSGLEATTTVDEESQPSTTSRDAPKLPRYFFGEKKSYIFNTGFHNTLLKNVYFLIQAFKTI